MRTVPLTAVPGCVDERQPRGRRPLAIDKAAADSLATDAWKVASRA